jgi:RHS repeat-associated protein
MNRLLSLSNCSILITLLLALAINASAQQTSFDTDGTTSPTIAPGAPAGSFALSGFERVNPFNRNLNFALPLLRVGGRGKAGYTIMLKIERKWRVEHVVRPIGCGQFGCSGVERLFIPNPNWWEGISPGYGPGVLQGRVGGTSKNPEPNAQGDVLTRLTFTAADGTEYELVDQASGGKPFRINGGCSIGGCVSHSRGRFWITKDGQSATFISDTDIIESHLIEMIYPSGYMILRDGTRYRIDTGQVSWIRDTNGNKVTFADYVMGGPTTITDSLNRVVTINYGNTDTITYKGANGATRTITIGYTSLDNALRTGYSIQTLQQLFGVSNPPLTSPFNPSNVVSFVRLPDDRQYNFYYNSHGDLARVELPTGGAIEYDWEGGMAGSGDRRQIQRAVKERRTYPNGGSGTGYELRTVYFRGLSSPPGATTVEEYNNSGALISRQSHYFYGNPFWSPTSNYESPSWLLGKEYKTETYDGAGALLRRVEQTWAQRAPVNWWTLDPDHAPSNDPRIIETVTTLADVTPNLVSKQTMTYSNDAYNNVTDVYEYDFGEGGHGPLIRRTHTDYLTFNNGADYAGNHDIHIRDLAVSKIVYDASGNLRSQTDYVYDDYGAYPLVARPSIVQHDGGFHDGYSARGNVTGVIHRNPGGSPSEIHLHNQYDIAGNVVKKVDGRGVPIEFDFSDRFGSPDDEARSNAGAPELAGGFTYAFPTVVTNALGHKVYAQYDYHLGAPVNSEDINGIVGSVVYNDALDRPTQGIRARYKVGAGIPAERMQTTITYDDANRVITTTSDRDAFNDNILTGKSYYDGIGRTWRSAAYEGATWAINDTRFDALGRVSQVSNSYRADDPDSASPPGPWTTTDYDTLGRVVRVTTPDGATVDTAYSGNQVTATDQAGKRRYSESDALGRLIKATEDPGGNNITFYSYDTLGNLRQVAQGAQTRTFTYDSFSRLISVTNPENGTVTHAYDPNGNLLEKTDARGVRTTMTYDALSRVKSKSYSGTTPAGTAAANATPSVFYFYDDYSTLPSGAPTWSGTPSKGRLIGVTYGPGSEGTYFKYDAAGRIVTNHQRQGTSNYVTTYTYNRAGAVTREDRGNPARRRNLMSYDAAGRLSSMQTGAFSGFGFVFSDLVNNISYTPFGGLQSETYGNGLIHSMSYNERHQPTGISLGRPDNLESVFRINYMFGIAHNVNDEDSEITSVHNNGNIARIKYFISGTLQYSQTFQYDTVNRLRYAVEHNNGVFDDGHRAWYQTFDYDFYGNRGIDVEKTSDNADAANTALRLAEFSEANNRITRDGFVYDAAGNLTEEPGKRYTYDAENRIIAATVVGGVTSQYVYDGMGRRVKKTVGGVATRFEYGAGGELIAERNDSNGVVTKDYFYKGGELLATTRAGGGYEFATADHLGSPRAWTGSDGALVPGGRHDYMAFGGELFAGYGTRTADQGYATSAQQDGQRKQFGSQQRDAEIGLDFMQARYYSSLQGRFTSVDPINVTAMRMLDPQRLNLYSFGCNNPLSYTDPTGMEPESDEERRKKIQAQIDAAKKKNPDLPVPTVGQIETGISVIWGLNGYNYEPADDAMTGPLAAAYVTAYQNEYQRLEDNKHGSTDPQSIMVNRSASETKSKTVGGKAGVEITISKDPSLTYSGEVNQSNTGSGTGTAGTQLNANIRRSSGADGARSSERQRADFVATFGKDGPMGQGMGASVRTSWWLGFKSPGYHDRNSYPEKLNQNYAGRIFDRVQSAAVSEVNRVFNAGRK